MPEEENHRVMANQWGNEEERIKYWTVYLNSPEGQDIASGIEEGEDSAQFLRFDGWLYQLMRIKGRVVATVVRKPAY